MRRADSSRNPSRHAGVTLIELIVVIVITGIIAAVLGVIIVRPIEGYEAQVRRAALVDAAEMALRRTERDIRQALPNSVRIRDSLGNTNNVTCAAAGVTCAIEMLNTVDGARYRVGPGQLPGPPPGHNHAPGSAGAPYRLQIPGIDNDGFNVVGFFQNIPVPFDSTNAADCPSLQCRLAIYNLGNIAADAYADGDESAPAPGSYVITRPGVTAFNVRLDGQEDGTAFNDEHQVKPAAGDDFRFRRDSPYHRVFIVDTPVTYICDPGTGTLTRYWNYPIRTAQPTDPAAAPLNGGQNALLTSPVSACTFTYTAGTNTRSGLVTLDITVRDNASGEQVRLLHQVHVDNSP